MASRKRRNQISGQFSARLIEMMESPAYRALSLSAHRVLSRIEIEMAHHGGNDNGNLPVTYEHFIEYGMDRHAVGPAISELEALGFIEVVERGSSGNAGYRSPSKYRLTYRHSDGADDADGSHEWRKITTMKEAVEIAAQARAKPRENRSPVGEKRHDQCGKPPLKREIPSGENPHYHPSGENPHYLYISVQGGEGEGPPLRPPAPPLRLAA